MKQQRSEATAPLTMVHHIREIQLRLLATVVVLLTGMVVGYLFYEPLFDFVKAPLNAPLHYMSPAGSFTFIIKICMAVGIVAALPVAVYNVVMFVQPALERRLSQSRVYATTFASLVLAGGGAAFGYYVILPLALRFFYKFQVEGLEAIISADEYLRFVIGIIITFALIFQLPLLISLADHVQPLPPRMLFKAEKYIIVGSVLVGVLVPFALDPTVQLLIASPIILLYNLSILIVIIQGHMRRRRQARHDRDRRVTPGIATDIPRVRPSSLSPKTSAPSQLARPQYSIDGTLATRRPAAMAVPQPRQRPRQSIPRPTPRASYPQPPSRRRVAMDIHPMPTRATFPERPAIE